MATINVYSDLVGAPYHKIGAPVKSGVAAVQGELMGLNAAGEMVQATAAADGTGAAGEAGPIPCRGALFPDHITDLASDAEASAVRAVELVKGSNDTLAGEHRATMMDHGFILVNTDEDWGFSCDAPVYLGVGGGLTQTKPALAGEIVQVIGFPVNIDRVAAGEAVWVDIDHDHVVV